MYCPKCGSGDQETNSYCRKCGEYLHDFEGTGRKPKTPAEQFKLSLIFNLLSAAAGISMAIALFIVHTGKEDTHPVIFSAISLFIVISTWQTVSFFNNLKLRRRFVRDNEEESVKKDQKEFGGAETRELLPERDMTDYVQASVTENSTRGLGEKIRILPDAKKEPD